MNALQYFSINNQKINDQISSRVYSLLVWWCLGKPSKKKCGIFPQVGGGSGLRLENSTLFLKGCFFGLFGSFLTAKLLDIFQKKSVENFHTFNFFIEKKTYFDRETWILICQNKELIPCSCGGQSRTLPLPYSFKIQAKKPIVDVAQPCTPPPSIYIFIILIF